MLLMSSLKGFEDRLKASGKSEETVRSYMMSCKRFINDLQVRHNGPVLIQDVKEKDIEAHLNHLKTVKNYKPASINVALNGMRNLFQHAMRNELITKDPTQYVESVKNHQERRDYLTEEEVRTLLATISHEVGNLVVRTLAYTGLRISECLALTFQDIDFEKDLIHVRNGKGNKPRTIPLSKDLKPYLVAYKKGARKFIKNSEYFFATRKTGTISAVYINRLLKEAVKKLEWKKHVTCHVLRHSFASKLVKVGTGLPEVAALLGHSDFRTVTSVYVHVDDGKLEEAINQLAF